MKFNIITFGCKVNQYESNMMKERMLHHNFTCTENIEEADIVIINTCTVTNTADKKCLKTIKSILKNKKDKIIVVAGCSVQNNQEIYNNLDVDILLGNKDKSKIGNLINEFIEKRNRIANFYNTRDLDFEDMFISDYNHVRAFIKIEDGCDNFCTYCIIPFVRGKVRSKNFNVILEETKCLVDNGHKEIVLTGIHTGHYEFEGKDLSDLIMELEKIPGLERIRISSIEITELNDKFMNVLRNSKKLCDHLHIPLQAGSNEILKKMNRKYDLEYFENKINLIRSIRPNISITTDIIVGFPQETEELFTSTLNFSRKVNFAKIHVFPFSPRKGTVAASMDGAINEVEKKRRVKELIMLSDNQEKEYFERFAGTEVDVLIEKIENGKSYGHTSNYLYVELNEELEIGIIYKRVL